MAHPKLLAPLTPELLEQSTQSQDTCEKRNRRKNPESMLQSAPTEQ